MSEIFSKNVIINKSDTILMQGNGIFLLGSLDMACETHRSTNIFEDCESAMTGTFISFASIFRERLISAISCSRDAPLFPVP